MQHCSNHKWGSLLFVGCSFLVVQVDADVIHVPGDQPTIQAGIDAATIGDEVVVADGIYIGPGNRNLDFGGKLITVRSANGADNCTIDCQNAGRAFIFHSGETSQARVAGFTITEGYVLAPEFGGAIRCENSGPTIADCAFVHNIAHVDDYEPVAMGGALYCHNSSPTILNCTFDHNHSSDFMKNSGGGAIWATMKSNLIVTDCRFTDNTAIWGGGVVVEQGSSGTLIDCTFSGNIAYFGSGGGLAIWNADLTIIDCVFSQNITDFGGAGLSSGSSTVYAEGCSFIDNYGGGAKLHSTESVFVNCRFIGNEALDGGGMTNRYGTTTTLLNCLFSGNRAQYGPYPDIHGGAMFNVASEISLINCTLSGNTAGLGLGGGMYNVNTIPKLTNCILWGNSDSTGAGELAQLYFVNGWAEVDYSCVQGLTGDLGGTGNIGPDPLFVDPDGPDDAVGTEDDDLHLQADSPAINAGEPCSAPDTAPTDFDGDDRIQHCRVDMGADESPYFALVDCNGNGVLDACDAAEGSGTDCDCNGVLDECDIAEGTSDDCNDNGSPDACDLAAQSSPDCNNNAVPDECDVAQPFFDQSEPLSPLGDNVPLFHTIPSPPSAIDDVTFSFAVVADLDAPNEFVLVVLNSTIVGRVFETDALYCPNTPNTAQLVMSAAVYNDAVDGGDATIMIMPSSPVEADLCFGESYITVATEYPFPSSADSDGSGIPDECEALGDLDGDGHVGPFDLALLLGNWGLCGDCTVCPADLEGDCTVGPEDLAILLGNWG